MWNPSAFTEGKQPDDQKESGLWSSVGLHRQRSDKEREGGMGIERGAPKKSRSVFGDRERRQF